MSIVLIVQNVRSSHNVGSLFRTCEGLGIHKIYLSGYTPYPALINDSRLPHISSKITEQIHKTALGAEISMPWEHSEKSNDIIDNLVKNDYLICALEQAKNSISLNEFIKNKKFTKLALIVGNEITGLDAEILQKCSNIIEIEMFGDKESFNVSIAAGIALYTLIMK